MNDARDGNKHKTITEIVEEIAHYLPSQRTIEAFVHHNTLHSFEDYTFEEGVGRAQQMYGSEAYMSEEKFRLAWKEGRISSMDLHHVISKRLALKKGSWQVCTGLESLCNKDVLYRWLLYLPTVKEERSANWLVNEYHEFRHWDAQLPREAFERLTVGGLENQQELLWERVQKMVASMDRDAETRRICRPNDALMHFCRINVDSMVHPKLIHWCKAYLDKEMSLWTVEDREKGILYVVLEHLFTGLWQPRWLKSLKKIAKDILNRNLSPEDVIQESLVRIGWKEADVYAYLKSLFLALPGWAGIFQQMKERPDLSPFPIPDVNLVQFAALRVLLEEAAVSYVAKKERLPFPSDQGRIPIVEKGDFSWRVFSALRLMGIRSTDLNQHPDIFTDVLKMLEEWPERNRQAIWQNAYERHYRNQIFDAILLKGQQESNNSHPSSGSTNERLRAQIVFCIDDREESIRRHIEEIDSGYQTFGFAGFYGVAMYFQPYNSPVKRPLCPAFNIPKHLVVEKKSGLTSSAMPEKMRRGQNTLFRGTVLTFANAFRLFSLGKDVLGTKNAFVQPKPPEIPKTTLVYQASEPPEIRDGLQVGFTHKEMVGIVKRCLEDIGLIGSFAKFVVICGHGSDSANNPHVAAYDCGACGGGKGAPNARIFAIMANDSKVREDLALAGIVIPQDTWFVGGYHNTSSDIVEYYDEDLIPDSMKSEYSQMKQDVLLAAKRDAHERARRFESIDLDVDPEQAYRLVQLRSRDLAEPRPECGHATNALCFVGKRAWSKSIFFDRRVFLVSYDSDHDPQSQIVRRLLANVGPVGAGINLEYYFSYVDPNKYGANTKLPHNVASLIGVMNGQESDLVTGLPWQMVEIHEPMRLLNIVESTPERILPVLEQEPYLKKLIVNRWILVALFDPKQNKLWYFDEEGFVEYQVENPEIESRPSSLGCYQHSRININPILIDQTCVQTQIAKVAK